jgi:hypothetical protein
MSDWQGQGRSDEHDDVVRRLRAERPQMSPLELDELKRLARAKALRNRAHRPRERGGVLMRSRLITLLLIVGLMSAGGTAGVIAAQGGGGNASGDQYKPGCGIGDKNHTHTGPPGNPLNDCVPGKP